MFKPTARSRASAAASNWRDKVEKLRAPREARTKAANISVDGASLFGACTIRDLSATGARISVTNASSLPEEFMLICNAEDLVARVRIAWRKPTELGVRFLRKGGLHMENEMRNAQAKAYAIICQSAPQPQQEAPQSRFIAQAQQENLLEHFRLMRLDPTLDYTPDQLKRQYRALAMHAHPDQGGNADDFQTLTNSYFALNQRFGGAAQ